MTWYRRQQKSNTDVNTGYFIDIESGASWKIGGVAVTPTAVQMNKLTTMGSSAAAIDAAVAGEILVYRKNVSIALVNAGATAVVPAVAGQRFQAIHIAMRSNGAVAGATTVGVKEDGGAVFLSQAAAGLTDGVWQNLITGTPVVTGMTSGGMTAVANKALLAYCAGGVLITATSLDFIVAGYYTTT